MIYGQSGEIQRAKWAKNTKLKTKTKTDEHYM